MSKLLRRWYEGKTTTTGKAGGRLIVYREPVTERHWTATTARAAVSFCRRHSEKLLIAMLAVLLHELYLWLKALVVGP